MKRKRLTGNQKLALWEKWNGKCWRCGLPIDHNKKGQLHWGHIIALGCGGSDELSNLAPEHSHCNLDHAAKVDTPMAAKGKRIRKKLLGIKEQSPWSKRYHAMKEWKRKREQESDTP